MRGRSSSLPSVVGVAVHVWVLHAFHQHADLVDPVLGIPELVRPEVAGGAVLRRRAGGHRDVAPGRLLAGLPRHGSALLPQVLRRTERHPPGLDDLVDVAPLARVDVHHGSVRQRRSVPEDASVGGAVCGHLVVAQPTRTGPAVGAVGACGDTAVLDPRAWGVVGLASVGDDRQSVDPDRGDGQPSVAGLAVAELDFGSRGRGHGCRGVTGDRLSRCRPGRCAGEREGGGGRKADRDAGHQVTARGVLRAARRCRRHR